MGNGCSAGGCDAEYNSTSGGDQLRRLDLDQMDILEFERRVKRFAHPINKGRVTVDQLYESFKDTQVFSGIRNPYSVMYKLLLSPFFRQLPMSHYGRQNEELMNDIYVQSETAWKRAQLALLQKEVEANDWHDRTPSDAEGKLLFGGLKPS